MRRALALELGEGAAQHARDAAQLEDLADHLLEVRLLRGRVGVGVGVRVRVRVRVRVKVGVRVRVGVWLPASLAAPSRS